MVKEFLVARDIQVCTGRVQWEHRYVFAKGISNIRSRLEPGVVKTVMAEVRSTLETTPRHSPYLQDSRFFQHRSNHGSDPTRMELGLYSGVGFPLTESLSLTSFRRPIIGGLLSDPEEHWPDTWGKLQILRENPYLLPCAAVGLLSLLFFFLGLVGLKEVIILRWLRLQNVSLRSPVIADDPGAPKKGKTADVCFHRSYCESTRWGENHVRCYCGG